MDLLVWVRRGEEEILLVAKVKAKPRHNDVKALQSKAELVEARLGRRVASVLTTTYPGIEI